MVITFNYLNRIIKNSHRHICKLSAMAFVFHIGFTAAVQAQVCLFPDLPVMCTGADCEADFQQSNSPGPGTSASVNLGEGRVQVRAHGGAGVREADGIVGIRITPERDSDVDFSTRASFDGVLQGSVLPNRFGRIRVWSGVRNLDTGATVVEVLAFEEQKDDNDVLVPPQFPLQAITAEFTVSLEADTEYAVYFRVKAQSRGLTSNSDFRTGGRGVFFEAFEMQTTSEFPDADGDSLYDDWEDQGILDCDDNLILYLPAMGTTSDHKDIFIEYDWTPGNAPVASSIATVKTERKPAMGQDLRHHRGAPGRLAEVQGRLQRTMADPATWTSLAKPVQTRRDGQNTSRCVSFTCVSKTLGRYTQAIEEGPGLITRR